MLSYILVLFLVVTYVEGKGSTTNSSSIVKEAEILWDRLLQQDEQSIPVANPGKPSKPVASPIAAPISCVVDVTIDCVTLEGFPCDDIQPPNPVCSVGSKISSVTFGYNGKSCNPSGNSQGSESFCQDLLQIDVSETVTALCQDAGVTTTGLVVEPPMIPIGGILTITAPSGNLPDKINCIISDSSGSQIQNLIVDSSGQAPLQLTDEFGAFTLLACANSGESMGIQSCLDTLTYNVEITNSGEIQTDLTTATFDFDDKTVSLLSEGNNVLLPGKSISFERRQLIDLCIGAEYCAESAIEAKTFNGALCGSNDQFCIQLSPLPTVPVSPPFPESITPVPVKVPMIPPFSAPLFPPVKAPLITPFSAPVSPAVKAPVIPPFSAPVTPPVSIPVIPPFSAPVTSPVKAPVIPPFSVPIPAPVKAPTAPSVTVPVSSPSKSPITIPVTAPVNPPIPVPKAPTSPIPSTEACILALETTCTISGDSSSAGKPCDTPTVCLEQCTDRPLQLTLLYNGGDCSQSDNAQALKSTCADSNGGPPTTEGSMSFIVVTDIQGNGTTYFQGTVPVGSQYVLADGVSRVGSDMFINIFTEDKTTLLQAVQFHTSCTNAPLELKDRIGASQLVQFTNAAQGSVSCSVDFSFRVDISVPTSVTGSVNLTSLIATTNFGGDVDLTDRASGEIISSGDSVAVVLEGEVDASVRFMYEIMFNVEGTQNPGGTICKGMDKLSFEAGNRPDAPAIQTPNAPSAPRMPTIPTPAGRRAFT